MPLTALTSLMATALPVSMTSLMAMTRLMVLRPLMAPDLTARTFMITAHQSICSRQALMPSQALAAACLALTCTAVKCALRRRQLQIELNGLTLPARAGQSSMVRPALLSLTMLPPVTMAQPVAMLANLAMAPTLTMAPTVAMKPVCKAVHGGLSVLMTVPVMPLTALHGTTQGLMLMAVPVITAKAQTVIGLVALAAVLLLTAMMPLPVALILLAPLMLATRLMPMALLTDWPVTVPVTLLAVQVTAL